MNPEVKLYIIAVLKKLRETIEGCRSIECATSVIDTYIEAIDEKTTSEILKMLGL
ncbi:hypothetical protein [Desulfurococcus mucosus]|uniref:Uncharacterized protein n=1 Tax=Desulfurococcus mucosus (strain ATCC 35584 / DSM 2162 / JCM 9187 / O7/1) TaxID=765177 RepID=E8R887_DESM0|nr:hypothetical protein [Desulfurococcus mucosus]ADV64713.1 hypothetical protein Desmu_0394 [Desulfurococcus mucosus DSM 2162]